MKASLMGRRGRRAPPTSKSQLQLETFPPGKKKKKGEEQLPFGKTLEAPDQNHGLKGKRRDEKGRG